MGEHGVAITKRSGVEAGRGRGTRPFRRRVVTVLVAVAAGVGLSLTGITPALAAGSITVTPNTDLTQLQWVTVEGSGWQPGATIGVCQGIAPTSTNYLDFCRWVNGRTEVVTAVADAQGHFVASRQVATGVWVGGDSGGGGVLVPCQDQTCAVLAFDMADISGTGVSADLAFRPRPAELPKVVPGTVQVLEGNAGTVNANVPVTLSGPSLNTVTVLWATVLVSPPPACQADPATDYVPASGTVTFAPGETAKTAGIPVNGDTLVEPGECIVVRFQNPTNAKMINWPIAGWVTIFNDDRAVVLPGTVLVTEGNAGTVNADLPVTLSNASTKTVTVDWTTIFAVGAPPNQADAATDYVPASGTVTFAPGETAKTVRVAVNGDTLVEPAEYIVVSFRNPTNAVMGGYWGLGYIGIMNDD